MRYDANKFRDETLGLRQFHVIECVTRTFFGHREKEKEHRMCFFPFLEIIMAKCEAGAL